MATLELKNIAKRFGGKTWGVKNISMDVKEKEFVVLLGPSGCGKTTTLRLIAGLEEITSGSILIDSSDVTFLPPRKRNISMVFQNYAVWPHMTVFENIAFPLRLKKMPEKDITASVKEVARMTKIDGFLGRVPRQLSGGQQQRVALARALVVKPKLFLMDEPFSNLDASLRVAMRTELKAIHQQAKSTTIFVTHDQAEAMSMADRIVIIKDGEIVQIGTPDDVYFRCANVFVAGFIGTPPMNFFEVDFKRSENNAVLSHPSFNLVIALDNRPELSEYTNTRLILGIRPEDISLVNRENALFSAKALVVEPQGSHQVVSVKLNEQIVKFVMPPSPRRNAGDSIHTAFRQNKLHFFNHHTTNRLQ